MPAKLLINLKIFIWGEVSHNMPKHVWRSKVKDNLRSRHRTIYRVQDQTGLHSESVSKNKKTKKVRD